MASKKGPVRPPQAHGTVRRMGRPRSLNPKPNPRAPKTARPLTVKQRAFVERYMLTFNATQAYRESHPGVAYCTALREGQRLLKHPTIAPEVKERIAEETKRYAPSAANVMKELAALAYFDPRELYDADGKMIPIHELPARVTRAIKKVKSKELIAKNIATGEEKVVGHLHEVETGDKLGALKLIGVQEGMFVEKHEVKVGMGFAEAMEAAAKRAAPFE